MKLTKEQRQAYRDYIIQCIDDNMYPDEIEGMSDKEKINFVLQDFIRVQWRWRHTKYPHHTWNLETLLVEYFQGLPGTINIAFTYHDIIKLAENIMKRELSEKEQEKVCDNYWRFIAHVFIMLVRKHGLMGDLYD